MPLLYLYSPSPNRFSFVVQLSLLLSTLEPTLTSFCKMSISPAATTQATGECVVCGKETVTRCSACAKNGTEWMFFCSTEHQKLVSPSRLLFSAQIRAESSTYIDLEGTQTSLRRQVKPVSIPFPFGGRDSALYDVRSDTRPSEVWSYDQLVRSIPRNLDTGSARDHARVWV